MLWSATARRPSCGFCGNTQRVVPSPRLGYL
jgi:hypothetical protein